MKTRLFYLTISIILLFTACTEKNKSFIVKFEGATAKKMWPLRELNRELPVDWSSSVFLTFEMNSTSTQRFELILSDAEGVRKGLVHPLQGVWVRASVPLARFKKLNAEGTTMSATFHVALPGCWVNFHNGPFGSLEHIDSLGVAMINPIGSPLLEIRNVRLTTTSEDTIFTSVPLVDEFGQWIPADWPGKAKTIDELKAAWREEDKGLLAENKNVSKYGGFLGGKTKATGFFRVEKIDGKWWFIDPDGYFFFSDGITGIGPRSEVSRVQGREYIFAAMPPAAEVAMPVQPGRSSVQSTRPAAQPAGNAGQAAISANQGGQRSASASFYTWNLYRRFGSDWFQKWMDLTVRRMDNWGINTIANWSDNTLGGSHRKPYVVNIGGWGTNSRTMGMPDVYATDYISTVEASAARQCAQHKDDPYLIGYFIGNEPIWPDRESELVDIILKGDSTAMRTELKKFLSGGDTPERRKTFIYDTYSKFIGIVNKAIKKSDPNHLNLGLRFGGSVPAEIVKASKNSFDVFSINIYAYAVDTKLLQNISDLCGLPIIIGEFHFGTPGRGLAPGLAQTKNQEERGVAYRYYIENAAAHPAVVGTHWFQWLDQPSTGRGDGEDYNIGFVDVTDRPYSEMVNASKETFNRLFDIHSGKIPPVTRKALIQ